MQTIFDLCAPRDEVLRGELKEDIFAARLKDVVDGTADPVYGDPQTFFENTYPTAGLKTLLKDALGRLVGDAAGKNAIIRPATAKPGAVAKPAERPRLSPAPLPQVRLPDLGLASEGAFSQRLKRVQTLGNNPTPAEIAELVVFLAAPESSLRWLARATLSGIGGVRVAAGVKALLEKEISDEARQEARKLLDDLQMASRSDA
jgi:hypothetical protein